MPLKSLWKLHSDPRGNHYPNRPTCHLFVPASPYSWGCFPKESGSQSLMDLGKLWGFGLGGFIWLGFQIAAGPVQVQNLSFFSSILPLWPHEGKMLIFSCLLASSQHIFNPVLYGNRVDPVQSLWRFQNLVWNGLTVLGPSIGIKFTSLTELHCMQLTSFLLILSFFFHYYLFIVKFHGCTFYKVHHNK